jgi:hypothetical protein
VKRTPLARKTPIRPGKRIRKVNAKRAAERRAECFGRQADLCRRLPCVACAWPHHITWRDAVRLTLDRGEAIALPTAEPHHEPPRSCGSVDKDCTPLCRLHHTERHTLGRKGFEEAHGVDLRAVARGLHAMLGGGE